MFSLTSRRANRKWLCTLAAAVAAAAVAVAALAGSALATGTVDTILKQDPDPSTHAVSLGGAGSCSSSGATANSSLDWNENNGEGTVQPKLTASLCLHSTTNTYRVALREYVLDATPGPVSVHVLVAESHSLAATGNGAATNDFSVNLQGSKVISANVHHVHAVIQQLVGGVWQDVPIAAGGNNQGTADF
jgi:hypothetical protein